MVPSPHNPATVRTRNPLVEFPLWILVSLICALVGCSPKGPSLMTLDSSCRKPDSAWLQAIEEADRLVRDLPSTRALPDTEVAQIQIDARNPTGGEFPASRGPESLMLYTSDYGNATGTNDWGVEAVIADGRVLWIEGNNNPIYPKGFILSGHGRGKDWILRNLLPGDEIVLEGQKVTRYRTAGSRLWRAAFTASLVKDKSSDLTRPNEIAALDAAFTTARDSLLKKDPQAPERVIAALHQAERLYYGSPASRTPEARGVWVRLQPEGHNSIESLLDSLQEARFNLILPETVYYGRTIYPRKESGVLDQWEEFAGTDPLADLIEAAHRRGMEVHAWCHIFFVGFDDSPLLTTHPDWLVRDRQGSAASVHEVGYYFVQPTHPEARAFLMQILEDLVRRYDVDGLQLDYIRYPNTPDEQVQAFDFSPETRKRFQSLGHPDPLTLDPQRSPREWKAWEAYKQEAVSSFVNDVHTRLKAIKPTLQLSAAVFPDPEDALKKKMQNWKSWIDAGWLDYVSPMAYYTDSDSVERDTRIMRGMIGDRVPLFTGIGPYLGLSPRMLVDQVVGSREGGSDGVILFSHNDTNPAQYGALAAGVFRDPAGSVPREPIGTSND